MKKIAIAGASAALAALPVVGVFATAGPGSFTDSITVTVNPACTIETSATGNNGAYSDRSFTEAIAAGTKLEFGGAAGTDAAMTISCNDPTKTWTVKADASDTEINSTATAVLANGQNYIKGGTATSGDESSWAFKITADNGGSTTYSAFTAVPAGEVTVLSGTGSGATFQPSYQVYVAPTQATGSYGGSVVYTMSE